jgi:hypothetical protein
MLSLLDPVLPLPATPEQHYSMVYAERVQCLHDMYVKNNRFCDNMYESLQSILSFHVYLLKQTSTLLLCHTINNT